jgi:phosphopentomutase
VEGYAKALMDFDAELPELTAALQPDDLLLITADHGNDPTAPGTDHTREFIPILAFGNGVQPGPRLGLRTTFADIAATVAEAINVRFETPGVSFYTDIYALNTRSQWHTNP